MIRETMLAAFVVASAAGIAYARTEAISAVDVTADLSTVQNQKAAAYWANLEIDLENAIASRLVGRIAEDGPELTVDISELELANGFERAFNLADAVLAGQVKTRYKTTKASEQTYDLTVSLATAGQGIVSADGQSVTFTTMDTPVAYETLVNAFAQSVVDTLDK
jgi:hypothetical protein